MLPASELVIFSNLGKDGVSGKPELMVGPEHIPQRRPLNFYSFEDQVFGRRILGTCRVSVSWVHINLGAPIGRGKKVALDVSKSLRQ